VSIEGKREEEVIGGLQALVEEVLSELQRL